MSPWRDSYLSPAVPTQKSIRSTAFMAAIALSSFMYPVSAVITGPRSVDDEPDGMSCERLRWKPVRVQLRPHHVRAPPASCCCWREDGLLGAWLYSTAEPPQPVMPRRHLACLLGLLDYQESACAAVQPSYAGPQREAESERVISSQHRKHKVNIFGWAGCLSACDTCMPPNVANQRPSCSSVPGGSCQFVQCTLPPLDTHLWCIAAAADQWGHQGRSHPTGMTP